MRQLTIAEFNKEFGVNTWGYEKYKMVREDDIGTFVSQKPEGYTIPYFCEWIQADTYEGLLEQYLTGVHSEIIEIVKG